MSGQPIHRLRLGKSLCLERRPHLRLPTPRPSQRATPQAVTLEDLNVSVSAAAVAATATATPTVPTVMTLVVTATMNVNRMDELRLGNARFLNVGVK